MEDLNAIRKDNLEKEKSLFQDNKMIITDMIVYLNSSNLCEYDIETIRKDLISMALESQLRGEKFSKVIDEDYKEFCDKLIEISDKKNPKEKILNYIFVATILVASMFVLEIIMYLTKYSEEITKFHIPLTWGFVISTVLTIIEIYAVITIITRNSFKFSGKDKRKVTNMFGIAFILSLWIIVFTKYYFRESIIISINYLWVLFILLTIFIVTNRMKTSS